MDSSDQSLSLRSRYPCTQRAPGGGGGGNERKSYSDRPSSSMLVCGVHVDSSPTTNYLAQVTSLLEEVHVDLALQRCLGWGSVQDGRE